MSYADDIFKQRCEQILKEGVSDEGYDVRPRWEDGTPAYTKRIFGVVNEYDLTKEFPIMTLRRTALRSAVDEILWIYQKKSNNVNELNSHIWDSWADKKGSIGKAYGYQIGKVSNRDGKELDQMDAILDALKNKPYDRGIMTNMFNIDELSEMNLRPCAYGTQWEVTGDKLNLLLHQRSQDMLTASNWNVCQYAILLMMVAQVSGFIPGKLVHVIGDCHIYDRHEELVKELIKLPTHPTPTVMLNPRITNFYDFTVDDVIINSYKYNSFDHKIPVAI